MGKMRYLFAVIALSMLVSYLVIAQAPPNRHPMGFFITSVGLGHGGNLGGLAGADAHCQRLAPRLQVGGDLDLDLRDVRPDRRDHPVEAVRQILALCSQDPHQVPFGLEGINMENKWS